MGKGCNDYAEISLRRTSKCGGTMKVVAFIIEHAVVDRIIDHLGLTFVADKPPPFHVFAEVALMAADESADYL